jgi:hypothetical protein
MGPNGIRAGWRLLLFLLFFIGMSFVANKTLQHIPAFATWAKSQPTGTINATFGIATEGLTVAMLLFAVWIMSKIEKRSFADYGLPFNQAFGKRFWQGVIRVSCAFASAGSNRSYARIFSRRNGDRRHPGNQVRRVVRRVFHIRRNL